MAELVCGTGDREAWLAARREGITATDLPVILGLVTWDSPFALYWRKKGKLPEVEQSDRMRLGSWLEDAIAHEWSDWASKPYASVLLPVSGLYRSSSRPWQLATPDRLVANAFNHAEVPVAVLECKTSATRDGWGKCWTAKDAECAEEYGKVPASVRAQVLWQMDTLDVATGHVAVVFLPSGEFRSYTISHAFIECAPNGVPSENCPACKDIEFMRQKAYEFWCRLRGDLLGNPDPPPVDGLQVTTDALRHLHAGAVKGKRAEIDRILVNTYLTWCDTLEAAKKGKRENENRIRQAMGDATLAVVEGETVARREVFKRAGYTVAPCEVDRLVRVKPREDEHDE